MSANAHSALTHIVFFVIAICWDRYFAVAGKKKKKKTTKQKQENKSSLPLLLLLLSFICSNLYALFKWMYEKRIEMQMDVELKMPLLKLVFFVSSILESLLQILSQS